MAQKLDIDIFEGNNRCVKIDYLRAERAAATPMKIGLSRDVGLPTYRIIYL